MFLSHFWVLIFSTFHENSYANNLLTKPISVVTEIAPPLQFMNGDKLDGQTTKQVRELLAKAGLEANFQVYPWARAFQNAQSNSNTLIYPIVRTPERESQFEWIGRLLTFKMSIIQLDNDKPKDLQTLQQAKSLKLGLMRNDYAHLLFEKQGFKEGQHFQLASELSQLIALLYSGKIDAMVADLPLLKVMAISQGFAASQLKSVFDIPDQEVDVYLAASKFTDCDIVNKLRQQLN